MLSRTTEQHELNRLCLARFVVIWENLVLNLKKLQSAKPCKLLYEETSVNNLDPCSFNRELN